MSELQLLKKGITLRYQDREMSAIHGFITVQTVDTFGQCLGLPAVFALTRIGYDLALDTLINGIKKIAY